MYKLLVMQCCDSFLNFRLQLFDRIVRHTKTILRNRLVGGGGLAGTPSSRLKMIS